MRPFPAQGQVAAKVWIPALVIFVLAVLLPLPLHRLRLRVIARNRARAAMAVATMQRQEQIKGVEKAYGEEEGGARRPRSFWGATWAYIVRAWSWLEPVLEVVEPRLCVVIYWTDVVSDFVFVTGYKGWSRQPAPAITVLFIILGNMVRGPRGRAPRHSGARALSLAFKDNEQCASSYVQRAPHAGRLLPTATLSCDN